jgi:hypothetical protein
VRAVVAGVGGVAGAVPRRQPGGGAGVGHGAILRRRLNIR